MGEMGLALTVTGMAIGVLFAISVIFIGLVRGMGWLGRRVSREVVEEHEPVTAEGKDSRTALITVAAVMAYLEAERKAATSAAQSKLKGEGGK
jgi:Na+-transporting methylmalonyl-CoA/oxaloacetate decarboxylase gamma subunit